MSVTEQGVEFEGGSVVAGKDGMVITHCVTKEQIEAGDIADVEDDCQSTFTKLDKKRYKSVQVCDGMTTESIMEFHSPTHFTGQSKTIDKRDGKTQEIIANMEGKWLASDCGDKK